MEQVGTVKELWRYPIKSFGGESLTQAALRWPGIDGDRQYAFVRAGNRSRFPWLTGREVAELVTYPARYVEPENPRSSPVTVAADGVQYDIGDARLGALLAAAAGEEISLLQVGRGTFNSMPVSIISTATSAQLDAHFGMPVDLRRFRINVVVHVRDGGARETEWLGGTLVFGEAPTTTRLRANVAIDRCVMITIDPDDASRRDPKLLRGIVEHFANEIGVRCTTDAVGMISVGDPVYLVRAGAPFGC